MKAFILILPIFLFGVEMLSIPDEEELQLIPDEKLIELRDFFKVDWPTHVHVYNFIDTAIRMKFKDKKFEDYVHFYSPEGDWSNGIVGIVQMDCYDVVIYSLDKMLKRLLPVLKKTKIVDWNRKVIFPATKNEFVETLRNLKKEISRPFHDEFYGDLWHLPKEEALSFTWSVPEDYYLSPLNVSLADLTFVERPRKRPNAKAHRARNIEVNGGLALFTKDTNKIVAWIAKNYLGAMSYLEVDEKFRRRGLATLLLKIFSKQIAQDGLDPIAVTERANKIAQHLFEKLGFEKRDAFTYFYAN